ncbi:hypothetical protein Tco_1329829 [Tanacetum coccineum]
MERDHTEQLLTDLAEARKNMKKRQDSPKTPPGSPTYQPPPPLPPAGPSGALGTSGASGSSQVPSPPPPLSTNQGVQSTSTAALSFSKTATSAEYTAWMTTDTRIKPFASALTSTYAPPPENSLLAQTGDMATFIDWYCKRQGITELTQKDLEGPAYEIVKVFHPNVIHLQFQMEEYHKFLTDQVNDAILMYNVSKPLPLGGEVGHVKIQPDFFNKDLEYLRYGHKIGRPALSISKIKAAYYPDVGLEQMVPDQMWIEDECKYDIAAMYGISHWWFQRQRFYIEGDHRVVRTHMRILSVVQIEVFFLYRYDYMKKIVLRQADLKEYIIAERDFKYLYPSDFEDLYLLSLQGHLNHLSPEDKKILTIDVNLWTRNLVIRHRMIMRFNEIHKFSDGTLQQIDEALDYRVKEFKVNRMNLGFNTRFWTKKDVDRSKEFMFAIKKRLKTRRIFRNLERFVGGRIREGDYRLLKRTE